MHKFQQRGCKGRRLACDPSTRLVRKVFSLAMHRRIEELAERVEEQDSGEDSREDFEFGVMMLEVHELVHYDWFDLISLQECKQRCRNQDRLIPTAHRHGQSIVRFYNANGNARHALELSDEVHVWLQP